jgi:hypothetical protein
MSTTLRQYTAAELRSLSYLVDLDVERIHQQIIQRAKDGFKVADFDLFQPYEEAVLNTLKRLFPDSHFSKIYTSINHFTYRVDWSKDGQPMAPAKAPRLY